MTCQTLSFDYVCSLIERLANFKFNAMLLEYADKFPYQGHRALSHPDAFSQRQVSQLLELAESLGIVVMPLVQTLAHAQFILRHPQFAHLSEVPGEISLPAAGLWERTTFTSSSSSVGVFLISITAMPSFFSVS